MFKQIGLRNSLFIAICGSNSEIHHTTCGNKIKAGWEIENREQE